MGDKSDLNWDDLEVKVDPKEWLRFPGTRVDIKKLFAEMRRSDPDELLELVMQFEDEDYLDNLVEDLLKYMPEKLLEIPRIYEMYLGDCENTR